LQLRRKVAQQGFVGASILSWGSHCNLEATAMHADHAGASRTWLDVQVE
jgi:hypothetical protein